MVISTPKILVVDDDPDILSVVATRLNLSGFDVITSGTGEDGLKAFFEHKPHLALLDIMMPGMDGLDLCGRIREMSAVPVIFLTAKGREEDKVRGLGCGADDYVVKPFGGAELVARIEAALRRAPQTDADADSTYADDHVSINFRSHDVTVRGEAIELTRYEFKMLSAFVKHPGQVLSQEQILNHVWGHEAIDASMDSVRLYVGYLRNKVEIDPKLPSLIQTVRGFGYRYRPA